MEQWRVLLLREQLLETLSEARGLLQFVAFRLPVILLLILENDHLLRRELEDDVQVFDWDLSDVVIAILFFICIKLEGKLKLHLLNKIITSVPEIFLVEDNVLDLASAMEALQ